MRYIYFIIILFVLIGQFIINNFDKFEHYLEIIISKNLFYTFMIIYLIFIIFNIAYWIYLIKRYSYTIIY